MGNGDCAQPVTAPLHHSFLLTLFPCSRVCPLHGLQSFVIKLLQRGSPRSCSSFRVYLPSLAWGPPQAAVVDACSSKGSSPWASGKYLLWHLEHLFPRLPLWCCFSHYCFSHLFHCSLLSTLRHFWPSWNVLSPGDHHFWWGPQLCLVVGLLVCWSWL